MALYNWNKSAMPVLSALLIGQTITLFAFTGEVKFTPVAAGAPCVVKSKATYLSVVWWCPLSVDTILFALTNFRIYQLRKLYSQMSPLLHMLRRDGILYYGVICTTYAANLINYYSNPTQSKGAGTIRYTYEDMYKFRWLNVKVKLIRSNEVNLRPSPTVSVDTEGVMRDSARKERAILETFA
ncbi:hypothetical protein Clacol_005203 [Clathrus columnatus]|uniref:Uncharacterized protein n=1 Tax=Clathrus columnatus TaxID=1419009 RepID=A0AAV5AE29_9AGAM|nr:hypothetical protein Clacol_005203 [Clathrus columnatus]